MIRFTTIHALASLIEFTMEDKDDSLNSSSNPTLAAFSLEVPYTELMWYNSSLVSFYAQYTSRNDFPVYALSAWRMTDFASLVCTRCWEIFAIYLCLCMLGAFPFAWNAFVEW